MAYQIFWKIPFKSLRSGTLYTVNIYKDGTLPSGYPLTLKGAAHPFTTQEDSSDDLFQPIRTQTGYLRIVDDGRAVNASEDEVSFVWKELLPETDTDRPVKLTHEENGQTVVDWQGFMQAQNFSGKLYTAAQEREFPIQCMLSALSASDVNGVNREVRNVAYVIKQAFDNLPGITISNYVFQGGTTAQEWLLKLVDWQNFIAVSNDGLFGKYDNQRIIQDVCQFWGWTCRTYRDNIIFGCVDDTALTGVLSLTQNQLDGMALNGVAVGSTSGTFLSSISLSGDIFASLENSDTLLRGYSRAVVTSDVNPSEVNVVGFAPSGVEKMMTELEGGYSESYNNILVNYSANLLNFSANYVEGECRDTYASFNISKIYENSDYNAANSSDVIRIYRAFASNLEAAYAALTTIFHHSFYDMSNATLINAGGLRLRGKIYRKGTQFIDHRDGIDTIGNKKMWMRLGIGKTREAAKWFTGTGWSSTVSAFTVAIGNVDDTLRVVVYRSGHQTTSYLDYIPTNQEGLIGRLFVEFLGSEDLPDDHTFDVSSFSIEFHRNTNISVQASSSSGSASGGTRAFGGARKLRVVERADSREYVAKNGNKSRNEWNADLIYTSDNDMEFGFGLLLNPTTGVQMGKQTYGSAQLWPEQRLANRVAQYWSVSKRKLELELRSNQIAEITPRKKITVDNTTAYPISISHNWHDDIIILTAVEL
ncbi:MAG: hypothetical protein K6E67_10330 [Prevotella sp.]|nr:hypothetical protein [Prevotella sp.]